MDDFLLKMLIYNNNAFTESIHTYIYTIVHCLGESIHIYMLTPLYIVLGLVSQHCLQCMCDVSSII
jgi:hypothetical protein